MLNHGGLWENDKTFRSVDFTTNCPRRRAGKPCKYCYVEASRTYNWNAKEVIDYVAYDGFVGQMRQSTVDRLNACGGIRLFSFADYMPEHDRDIQAFLDDCIPARLGVKVITKQTAFVDLYHDHPAINVIHLSIDGVGSGVPHDVAKSYRKKFRKVAVRCVILNQADMDLFRSLAWVDVLTLNHKALTGLNQYRKKARLNLSRIDPRVCCVTGKCSTCSIKCRKNEKVS